MSAKMHEVAQEPLLKELQKRIRDRMNDVSNSLLGGGCKNFPEYTKLTGIIEGYALAEQELLIMDTNLSEE
jgi:hypothetical protein